MIRIAQLSDPHLTVGSDEQADALAAALDRVGRLWPAPHCLLITGDLVDRGLAAEYDRLARMLAGVPVPTYLIPGNHDDRARLRAAFAHREGPAGPPGGPPDDFIIYPVDLGTVRVVMHDSTDPGRGGGVACDERLDRLDRLLGERPDVPTVLAMHHPPFRTHLPTVDSMRYLGLPRLAELVARHRQIVRIVTGHAHRPITAGFAGTVAVSCPSTWRQGSFGLPGGERLVAEPAAVALHLVEPDGAAVTHLIPVTDPGGG